MNNPWWASYRELFPVTHTLAYLDHAGVAPVSLRVKDAIAIFLQESTSSGAYYYQKWAGQVAEARRLAARLINAHPQEIAFVKNTSHGLSLVARGLDWRGGDNVIVYEREFPSNLFPWQDLKRFGVEARAITSRDGTFSVADIERLTDSRTRLVAISSVQFANGFRADLAGIGSLCREKKVLFCVDAIQSLGVIPMDVEAFHIDFLSADAHKWLLGPEGIGIFYCREGLAEQLQPALIGWKSVQAAFDFDHPALNLKTDAERFEEGSMNLMGIIGLAAAIELLLEVGIDSIEDRVLSLGNLIIEECDKRSLKLLTPRQRSGRGGNISFAGRFDLQQMLQALREQRIVVNVRGGGLRVSPHFYNTEEEIRRVFSSMERAEP